ncbi:hypothetical protein [Umezakia ovalisporum]|jgi:hypothetical protein|uniref:Uncharacterized protein n=2 Tax=Umezakia ovalisporum TaxID=75695 RepID=A0AA43GWG3_9CYAN|nr:hypothetical protein [Umezakia ovalisporum]MBI1242619.1 hypothetical protein [Nostoc sp. RI_552]MDH6057940.1 hypothetical protein [Umezakia ovalisporum FSS-43]MDH6063022.1 hypothetical protein [Umezakia ovalisporum FSS-62]MDH6066861.1 hypothetical protein [Umezakia ovalisporum APH033B]MDH6071964.1 hypothetical protein [Umezakia ovalisporum CobakiLakeA]
MDQPEEISRNGRNADSTDTSFSRQVHRLHQLTVYGRWLFVGCLWLTIAPLSLWNLRLEFVLLQQYFTWVAVRYGLLYNPLSTLGLSVCIGTTLSTLVWQSRNILLGIPQREKKRLEKQVFKIRQQGETHPLWRWISH